MISMNSSNLDCKSDSLPRLLAMNVLMARMQMVVCHTEALRKRHSFSVWTWMSQTLLCQSPKVRSKLAFVGFRLLAGLTRGGRYFISFF